MRVILVADNASTLFGGEAFIPFNYFRLLLARKTDVRLVVHARNRTELVGQFPEYLDRLHFVEDTWLHKALFRLGTFLPRRLADATTGLLLHFATQSVQRRIVRELVKKFAVDVIHQPIPVSPKTPSQIYALGAPVVIGPLNGGMEYPPAFQKEHGIVAGSALALGRAISILVNFIVPGKRLASLVLVANQRTRAALPRGIRGRVVELVENGVDLAIWQQRLPNVAAPSALRLVFVGRLIDWKALEIVLKAVARASKHLAISFEIIGDGPMRQIWQETAEQLGLESTVKFLGFLSQPECARRLQEADVFVLPSLFECGGAVVLEAMAVGLPVIATAWGGPLDYLDESCGILVEPSSREALIQGFSNAIERLAESAPLREQMGQAAYARACRHFGWDRKIDQIIELYASVSKPHASGVPR
jgi:glycosyltransferase involved in cell wall biosynthesis